MQPRSLPYNSCCFLEKSQQSLHACCPLIYRDCSSRTAALHSPMFWFHSWMLGSAPRRPDPSQSSDASLSKAHPQLWPASGRTSFLLHTYKQSGKKLKKNIFSGGLKLLAYKISKLQLSRRRKVPSFTRPPCHCTYNVMVTYGHTAFHLWLGLGLFNKNGALATIWK